KGTALAVDLQGRRRWVLGSGDRRRPALLDRCRRRDRIRLRSRRETWREDLVLRDRQALQERLRRRSTQYPHRGRRQAFRARWPGVARLRGWQERQEALVPEHAERPRRPNDVRLGLFGIASRGRRQTDLHARWQQGNAGGTR